MTVREEARISSALSSPAGPGLLFGDRRSGRGCQHGKAGKAYQKQRQRTQQRRADADMDKIADDGSPLKTGKKPPYITP